MHHSDRAGQAGQDRQGLSEKRNPEATERRTSPHRIRVRAGQRRATRERRDERIRVRMILSCAAGGAGEASLWESPEEHSSPPVDSLSHLRFCYAERSSPLFYRGCHGCPLDVHARPLGVKHTRMRTVKVQGIALTRRENENGILPRQWRMASCHAKE